MKKLTILAVLLTVISAASFADGRKIGETSKFQMIAKSDVKYDLYYISENVGDVRVTILDDRGRIMSSKTVKDARKFKRTYDFSQMDPGKYKVVVRDKNGTTSQEIDYKIKKPQLISFVSRIPDSKSLKLHVGDFNKEEPVQVKIYNQDNKLLYSEKIKNGRSFSKVYNLNNTLTKSVQVLIENDGERQSFFHSLK